MIKESADKLAADRTSRGDLKILSRALRELRWAFKVFAPVSLAPQSHGIRLGAHASPRSHFSASGRIRPRHGGPQLAGRDRRRQRHHGGRAFRRRRENSMGLNIMLPFEQDANPVIAGDAKLVHMKYFFTRKLMFVKECDAVCLLPGGFGTLDEGFEVLTLLQTGKRDIVPLVFLDEKGGSFWTDFDVYIKRRLLGHGMISPEDLSLYTMTDDVETAVREIDQFYRIYHSMRYVKNKLVFRLSQAPSPELLEEINTHFADILLDGQFTVSGALPDEQDEPQLSPLPRLVFRFNRRSLGVFDN